MREPRKESPSGIYHIVARGVNKQNIFYDDSDRDLFLELLEKYSRKLKIRTHAYSLMDNHVHILAEGEKDSISLFMQSICSLYARKFNRKYNRIGHLFQERFSSEVIDDDAYYLTVLRYILQNPEVSGICDTFNYKWSSYKHYNKNKSFLYMEKILAFFSNKHSFDDFLKIPSDTDCLEPEPRPLERETFKLKKLLKILKTDNPIIRPDLPTDEIKKIIQPLKKAGLSIKFIARTTGIMSWIVQQA